MTTRNLPILQFDPKQLYHITPRKTPEFLEEISEGDPTMQEVYANVADGAFPTQLHPFKSFWLTREAALYFTQGDFEPHRFGYLQFKSRRPMVLLDARGTEFQEGPGLEMLKSREDVDGWLIEFDERDTVLEVVLREPRNCLMTWWSHYSYLPEEERNMKILSEAVSGFPHSEAQGQLLNNLVDQFLHQQEATN